MLCFVMFGSFQEVINCLSVPRCSGDLLASFRSLLIATATLMKEGNLCPSLKYNNLKRYVTGKVSFFFLAVTQSGEASSST